MPGTQHDVDFMVKDSERFADSGGWGWGAFEYARRPIRLAPPLRRTLRRSDAKCAFACHSNSAGKRLRFHGVRAAVNAHEPLREQDCRYHLQET